MSSCTLQKLYETTGLEPTSLIFLCSSTLKVPDDLDLALLLGSDLLCLILTYLSKTTTDFPLSDFYVIKLMFLD